MGTKSISFQSNFCNGEISRRAMGRSDIKWKNAAKKLENILIDQLGGGMYRPGTRFVKETKYSAQLSRLFPFQYSTQQYYVIEAGDEYMRFFATDASLILTAPAGQTLDYMEYATNALAQAAYVSNDYGTLTSLETGDDDSQPVGDASDSEYATAQTFLLSAGERISSVAVLMAANIGSPSGVVTVRVETTSAGSPTGTLAHANLTATFTPTASAWNVITFASPGSVAAGTYAIVLSCAAQTTNNSWRWACDSTSPPYTNGSVFRKVDAGAWSAITASDCLFKVTGGSLQDYSEATIKNQGSYSLKGFALATSSANKTLTRTISSPVDLTGEQTLKFDIYSSRTGSNIKIGIHDSGGTTTEITPNVTGAGAWQTVTWDISAVANADKDAIDSIIITIANAGADNTFYIDNFYVYKIEIVSPYTANTTPDAADIAHLQTAQDADTMYFVHPTVKPYKLQRTSATSFTITAVDFVRGPFLDDNITAGTITPSAATGNGITLTASVDTFLATNVGGLFKVHSGVVKITAFTSTKIVTGNVQAEPDGSAGNLGGTGAYTDWAEGCWSDRRGWPSAVTFHEQRLYFGCTTHQPQTFWASAIGAYDSFDVGSAAADDAFSFEIATEQVNSIKWLSSSNKQIDIGTAGGTFPADGGGAVISPANIAVSRSTTYGVAPILPARIGGYLYYVQRNLNQVRELSYSLDLDAQKADDMNLLADHILREGDGAVEMQHQQSPNDRLWIVRNDGEIAVLTRNSGQEVMGWSRIVAGSTVMGPGLFESIAIIQQDSGDDQVWVIVNRLMHDGSVKRYVEFFTGETFDNDWDAVRVDCSLTYDTPKTITNATKANPVVISAAAHGFSDGDQVKIDNIIGMSSAGVYGTHNLNGNTYIVAGQSAGSFHLHTLAGDNVDGTLYATYIEGGKVRKMVTALSRLDHLEGETVSVTVDGVLPTTTKTYEVTSGAITLSQKAAVAHVGLPYVGDIQLLKLSEGNPLGTGQGSMRRVYKTVLRVDRSLGAKIGKDANSLSEVFDTTDTALVTGDRSPLIATGWNKDDEILIRQNVPLPFNLLSVILVSECEEP